MAADAPWHILWQLLTNLREIYNFIPCDLYGRLASLAANKATRPPPDCSNPSNQEVLHTSEKLPNVIALQNPVLTVNKSNADPFKEPARPNLRISLQRENGTDWSSTVANANPYASRVLYQETHK